MYCLEQSSTEVRLYFSLYKKLSFGVFILSLFYLIDSSTAHAVNAQLSRPKNSMTRGNQLFTSQTLPAHQMSLGIITNYSQNLLEYGDGFGTRSNDLLSDLVTTDFLMSFSPADWVTITVDMPVHFYYRLAPSFNTNEDKGGGKPGDIYFSSQFKVFDADKTKTGLGLAFIPFVTAPTGKEDRYMGDLGGTGGLIAAGELKWGKNYFFANFGFKIRSEENVSGLIVDDEFLYGLGFQRNIIDSWKLDILLEVYGSTKFEEFFDEEITSPVEASLSFRKKCLDKSNLVFDLGSHFGLTRGYGSPDFRIMAGVSYSFPLDK